MLRLTALATLMGLVSLISVSGSVSGAQNIDELRENIRERREERKQVKEAAAEAAAAIDVAEATADELIAALDTVQDAVDAQSAAVAEAEAAVAEAEFRQQHAEASVAQLEAELAQAQERLRDAVITSFVEFQTPEGSVSVFGEDLWRNSYNETLANLATGSRIDAIDDLRRIGSELEQFRAIADEAAAEAQAHKAVMLERLDELTTARDREAELTELAEQRLEKRLYEAQALKDLDAELAAEISRDERRIAEAIARARAEALAREAAASQPPNADFELTVVRGIVVNTKIADDTEGLLAAMEAAGFPVSGGGYRTHAAQIALRRAHCGTSDYAVWKMPASRCRPPTARPGQSDHEVGLAIDFTYRGRGITSRNSAVFQTLARIAPQYGFVNLPSEPWHWSNTG